eukprot:1159177-Pelagomonas_calceolata.AAC.6
MAMHAAIIPMPAHWHHCIAYGHVALIPMVANIRSARSGETLSGFLVREPSCTRPFGCRSLVFFLFFGRGLVG